MSKTVILIPSRLSAKRLPGKPLLKINGISIISHVVKKAKEADIGDVYVATEDKEIIDDVRLNGDYALIKYTKKFDNVDFDNLEYVLNDIKDSGEKAGALTKQLLAFSRKQLLKVEYKTYKTYRKTP